MGKYLFLILLFAATSCNYTITLVHTQGTASDVVDETDDASPTVSPTISAPLLQK
ncbi:MAG: hypothetical protein LLF94_05950 [Chlamydiales bacterium]|nr:hypothetical protein [Chlamydiales bacterium]